MYDTDDTTAHEPTEKRSLRFATDLEADVLLTDWTALRVHRVIFDETERVNLRFEALQTAADGVDIPSLNTDCRVVGLTSMGQS